MPSRPGAHRQRCDRSVDHLLNEKNPEIAEMARKLDFDKVSPGIVPFKGRLFARGPARGPCRAGHGAPCKFQPSPASTGHSHRPGLHRYSGSGQGAARRAHRQEGRGDRPTGCRDGIYLSGDKRAVPILLDTAKNGYVVVGGVKASDLRANAAIDLSRIAGKETYDAFKALPPRRRTRRGSSARRLTACR